MSPAGTDERTAEVRELLARVRTWAPGRPDVAAVALVGSWARDGARMDSDVDLILLTTAEGAYLEDDSWVGELGGVRILRTGRWGPLTERRFVRPSGLQVEVGVVPPSWAATDPPDPGTREVVQRGMLAVYDPGGILSRLADACREDRADYLRCRPAEKPSG